MYKSIIKPSYFTYATDVITLAAAATNTPVINFSNDSDFELLEVRAVIVADAALDGSVLVAMSLVSGPLLSNVALNVESFATILDGTTMISGYPQRLSEPACIPANTQLNVQIQNNSSANVDVQIQLIGYKVEKA